jgi:hypothetical protein
VRRRSERALPHMSWFKTHVENAAEEPAESDRAMLESRNHKL